MSLHQKQKMHTWQTAELKKYLKYFNKILVINNFKIKILKILVINNFQIKILKILVKNNCSPCSSQRT